MADNAAEGTDRRDKVVRSALRTFSRYGYRKTSMEDIAHEARISRPGLYFLFSSKQALFREAVTHALTADVDAAATALDDPQASLRDRVVRAFDCWAGRYVGPLRDVSAVIEDNPHLLGPAPGRARARFAMLLQSAIRATGSEPDASEASEVTAVLLDASAGLKLRAKSRKTYLAGMATATRLLLPD